MPLSSLRDPAVWAGARPPNWRGRRPGRSSKAAGATGAVRGLTIPDNGGPTLNPLTADTVESPPSKSLRRRGLA